MCGKDDKRVIAQNILYDKSKSDDLKLFDVFQIYKDEIKQEYSQLYYALLGWKDSHLKELLKEQVERDDKNA